MAPSTRPASPFRRTDALIVTMLSALPAVALSIPAIAGYPLITGDDLVQNYPLARLSGEAIAHGHLPIYDPYLWSGAPLLGGANAHALLPTTFLYAFLPGLVAWIAAEALGLAAAATGAFVLLRRTGCGPLPAALGGATFGFGGFVSSQIVHIDFVSAAAALIWVLVALDGLARGEPTSRPWFALLAGVGVAAVGLSGSPDILVDAVVVVLCFGGHLLASAPRERRGALLAWAGLGGAAGVLVSAVQLLPAAEFVAVSQRAHASFQFASSGSVSPAELLILLVPHILGGGPIGLESYTGPYNLAELDAYVGIVSLVAAGALLTQRRSPHASRWRVWYLVGAIGLVLALGSHTPLQSLLSHLPVVGLQRLPSRALILVGLASAMLLGYWAEEVLSNEGGARRPAAVAAGLAGPAVVLVLVGVTAVSGSPYGGLLRAVPGSVWSLRAVALYLAVAGSIAAATAVLVVLGRTWPRRRLAIALTALVVVDLLVFTANQSSLAPTYAKVLGAPNPFERQLRARLGPSGRFLVVDPARSAGISLDQVGAPNFGIFYGLDSAQGYGSLTWGPYEAATGTHSQDDLSPAALVTGTFDDLDVRVLLTVPSQLATPVRAAGSTGKASATAVGGSGGTTAVGPASGPATSPGLATPPVAGIGPVLSPIGLRSGGSASRWFGQALTVRSVVLRVAGPSLSSRAKARLGEATRLLGPSGAAAGTGPASVSVTEGTVTVSFGSGQRAVGLLVRNRSARSAEIASVTVVTRTGAAYALDGALSAYLTAPHWVASGTIGPFAVYANRRATGPFALQPGQVTASATSGAASRSLARGVTVVSSSPWTGAETLLVTSPRPATLVRSVADIPGWHATETHHGRSVEVAVRRVGLVQGVEVPAGTTEVTFAYDAPGLGAGRAAAAAGTTALAALALEGWRRRRRAKRRATRPGGQSGRPLWPQATSLGG